MAIPGLTPTFDLRAKVRVGEKKKSAKGTEYPSSVDYFICDDPDFQRVCGDKPKELTVILPFEKPEDNFSTGLEEWKGKLLVCYTKGEEIGGESVAYRRATMKTGGRDVDLLEGFKVLGGTMGNDRRPVHCRARECPVMKKGECKPMGRLQFFIKGIDRSLGIYQIDTKSWNTIEGIEGFLLSLGDPRNQELTLSVEMWSRGTSRFPVISLKGGNVEVKNEKDLAIAEALVQLHKAIAMPEGDARTLSVKRGLAIALDASRPGWREKPDFVARIQEVGAEAAAKGLLERYEL